MAEQGTYRLVAGLGNPGEQYALTRHNAGFVTVDKLAERHGARYWKSQAGCLVTTVRIAGRDVTLAKPQGFMNTSGGPLSKLMRELHIHPEELLVVHDEVDLPAGEVRDKFGGGLNAHNGLRSIKAKLGTADFGRVRVGIGRPPGRMSVADWALRKLKGNFAEEFDITCEQAADVVEGLL
ncbi:MAG: aminoacyl-tRNA hydrolase [Atopobiaceae bacterium]|nr:aminoacyl-tRNA hydrolase [Atopobiaceae bacterium]